MTKTANTCFTEPLRPGDGVRIVETEEHLNRIAHKYKGRQGTVMFVFTVTSDFTRVDMGTASAAFHRENIRLIYRSEAR